MDVRKMRNELLGKRLVAALESRNMEAYYVETKEEAVKKALELIPKGSSINMGGATSVKECGLYEALSNGEYQFYDRDKVSTQEEKQEIALKAFTSDYFLGSVNARMAYLSILTEMQTAWLHMLTDRSMCFL